MLLVEGPDDKHVLMHLCDKRGIPRLDEIVDYGGADKLLESFPVRLKASEVGDIVGLVVDADADITSRWQAIRNRLIALGYQSLPASPAVEGTIVMPPAHALLPRVGIWLMPDNQTAGILEDFLRFLVPQPSGLFDHVSTSVSNIPEAVRQHDPRDKPKVLIHTWLAWQKEPGKRMGTAITARYLDSDVAQVDALVSWLNRLYFQ